MVKGEDGTPKSEKESSSAQENTNTHLYPGWMANQAYYGPEFPLQPPYLYSPVMAGHVSQPYVWPPPQPLMPHYGVPYATIYSHGGVYAHPAVPFVATPWRAEMPSNSTDNFDEGLTKKLKTLDGVALAVGNGSSESDARETVQETSKSVERGIVGSADGSAKNARDERQLKRERRKQSNRESARKSRLRKQAVIEELLIRYNTFNVENIALKSELHQLAEDSEKLRLENAALREKVDDQHQGRQGKMVPIKKEDDFSVPNKAENSTGLNNTNSVTTNVIEELGTHANKYETKLKLLESSSRQDAVAAG